MITVRAMVLVLKIPTPFAFAVEVAETLTQIAAAII